MPEQLLKSAAVVIATITAVLVAVVAAFLVPLRIGEVRFPISILIVMAGNVVAIFFAHRVGETKWGVLFPALTWFIVTMMFGSSRPEGDVILPSDWVSLATLGVGAATLTVSAVMVVNGIDVMSMIRSRKRGTT